MKNSSTDCHISCPMSSAGYFTYARDSRLRGSSMPIRRLEEEGDRRAGTPPRLVAPRPSRAGSPALDNFSRRVIHHQSPRQRHADASTAEMIRFVRDYQLDRQPTLLRLQKRAPLPGIGQVVQIFFTSYFHFCSFLSLSLFVTCHKHYTSTFKYSTSALF